MEGLNPLLRSPPLVLVAGLNSLQAAANWSRANPGRIAIACGVEVCSAHFFWTYARDVKDEPKDGRGEQNERAHVRNAGCSA